MLEIVLVIGTVVCALFAIRARWLLAAALWLAACSALVSILFYILGAREAAVIELSVGAGLVTVLFVLAISVAGDDTADARALLPKPIVVLVPIGLVTLLAMMILPALQAAPAPLELSFSAVMWQQRGLDALVQSGLIFAAVVGLLGLLADARVRATETHSLTPASSPTGAVSAAGVPEVKA